MRVLPKRTRDRITFVTARLDGWTEHAATLRLSPQQVAEAAALAEAAREKYRAAELARIEARSATQELKVTMDRLTRSASAIVRTARSTALDTDDARIYTLAGIPAPKAPSPAGPPPQPRIERCDLHTDGSLTFRWRGTLSHKTFYRILRRLDGEARFTLVAALRARTFRDATIPAGTGSAEYYIVPRRGSTDGLPSERYTVSLGVPGIARAGQRAA